MAKKHMLTDDEFKARHVRIRLDPLPPIKAFCCACGHALDTQPGEDGELLVDPCPSCAPVGLR